jgi:hypothetical protein
MLKTKTVTLGFRFQKDLDIVSDDMSRLKRLLLRSLRENVEGNGTFLENLSSRQRELAMDLLLSNPETSQPVSG